MGLLNQSKPGIQFVIFRLFIFDANIYLGFKPEIHSASTKKNCEMTK